MNDGTAADVKTVVAALDNFVPNDLDNVWALYQLFEGFDELPGREAAMPAMFALMERHPNAEFGSPGPLVHALESMDGYDALLKASLARQPADLTVWMLNRILNVTHDEAKYADGLARLRAAAAHPLAPDFVRESALNFLDHQARRTAPAADPDPTSA